MSHTDPELFELCKSVYALLPDTFGVTDKAFYMLDGKVEILPMVGIYDDKPEFHSLAYLAPLYTSDYLLDKLPKTIKPYEGHDWVLYMETEPWFFTYIDQQDTSNYHQLYPTLKRSELKADIPLKALLKLTIALHKAGELK